DRKRNVIRRSGENIAAVEVENVMQQHPAIRSIAVAAVPDAIRGDEVMALIVPHQTPVSFEQKQQLAHDIVTWGLTQLGYFKVPGYVMFIENLPLACTYKMQRGELKTLALWLVEHRECIKTNALKKTQEIA